MTRLAIANPICRTDRYLVNADRPWVPWGNATGMSMYAQPLHLRLDGHGAEATVVRVVGGVCYGLQLGVRGIGVGRDGINQEDPFQEPTWADAEPQSPALGHQFRWSDAWRALLSHARRCPDSDWGARARWSTRVEEDVASSGLQVPRAHLDDTTVREAEAVLPVYHGDHRATRRGSCP